MYQAQRKESFLQTALRNEQEWNLKMCAGCSSKQDDLMLVFRHLEGPTSLCLIALQCNANHHSAREIIKATTPVGFPWHFKNYKGHSHTLSHLILLEPCERNNTVLLYQGGQ